MKRNTRNRFDKIINTEMDNVEQLQADRYYDPEELEKVYANLERLVRVEIDFEEKKKARRAENFKNVASLGVQMIVPLCTLAVCGRLFYDGLSFEEHGTIGSPMMKALLNTVIPKIRY